jgi:CBS domain containing-hemolysin-like protein
MALLLYTLGVLGLAAGLVVFSYVDRIFRELGRVTSGRVHDHLDIFETEIEPRLHIERRSANLAFSLISRLWLVLVAVQTARGVLFFVPRPWEEFIELFFFLSALVVLGMFFLPSVLLVGTTGRWLIPLTPVLRIFLWVVWPIQGALEFFVSLLHLSEEREEGSRVPEQEAIEALVEAAQEEGILRSEEAQLIEQVVEFSDKRVREVMTPRPDIVAIPGSATIEQLRRVVVETKFSRLPVYEKSFDDIVGIVMARDVLQVPEREATQRTVSELIRPALFVPETKLGSALLKEMQRKNQQMAIVTVEDLVEEIVGEIGEEDRAPAPDVIRESTESMVLRGSVSLGKVGELFGIPELEEMGQEGGATTVAGLLNTVAGRVPKAGDTIDYDGLRFEVLEANQRKVLRLRARRRAESAEAASSPA